MPAPREYDQETRDRAVRLSLEQPKSDPATPNVPEPEIPPIP